MSQHSRAAISSVMAISIHHLALHQVLAYLVRALQATEILERQLVCKVFFGQHTYSDLQFLGSQAQISVRR